MPNSLFGTAHMLRLFRYNHLPEHLKMVSQLFWNLATELARTFPEGPELTVSLRKLLESKDAAVRHAHLSYEAKNKTDAPF